MYLFQTPYNQCIHVEKLFIYQPTQYACHNALVEAQNQTDAVSVGLILDLYWLITACCR